MHCVRMRHKHQDMVRSSAVHAVCYNDAMWQKIECEWIAAYKLLHIAAYRLIGKRYRHQGGLTPVQPAEALSRGQQLFCLLFPLLLILSLALTLCAVWIYTYVQFFSSIQPPAYYYTAPLWHIALQGIALLLPLLASPAYFDLRRALHLLTEPTQQPLEQTHKHAHEGKGPQ